MFSQQNQNSYVKSEYARRHPIVALLYLVGVLGTTISTMHPVMLLISLGSALLYGSWLMGKGIWKQLLWMGIPLFVFTVILLPLFSHNGVTPLFYINNMAITWETILYGMVMGVMLLAVCFWFRVASQLIDGEKLFYLSGRIWPSLGLLVSMVFRMIPRMGQQFRHIREAQKGLGRDAAGMPWKRRVHMLIRELSILISWSLESSVETSVAMESRGYGVGRRTSFHLFRMGREDCAWCLVWIFGYGVVTACLVSGCFQTGYFPEIHIHQMTGWCSAGVILTMVLDLLPLLYDVVTSYGEMQRQRRNGGK